MSDDTLVKRLRDLAVDLSGAYIDHPDGDISTPDHAFGVADVSAAASRIEALEAETASLRHQAEQLEQVVEYWGAKADALEAENERLRAGSSTPLEPPQDTP